MSALSNIEKQAALSLSAIFALRMLGLFMIVPVFSLYAHQLHGATPLLIGVAMGCYGLTQAFLQIPFGVWSDHQGRKPIIALGLILFAFGSFVAALSHSIWGVIIGRSLQGAGAVGSATSALLADLTRNEQRTKAMAIVGITIGLSFFVAMILGPVISSWSGVPSIFWLSTGLALLGLAVLYQAVPTPTHIPAQFSLQTISVNFIYLLKQANLLRLNFGILVLHAILTASFIVLPIALQNSAGVAEKQQWLIYLPALLLAFISMLPLLRLTHNKSHANKIFIIAIVLLAIAESLLWWWQRSAWGIGLGLWLFFTAFTLLEALLPSAVSTLAPAHCKGMALGINSCCQFLGIFLGGIIGGWLYGYAHVSGVLLACVLLTSIWLLLAINE
jgi:MFS family permease